MRFRFVTNASSGHERHSPLPTIEAWERLRQAQGDEATRRELLKGVRSLLTALPKEQKPHDIHENIWDRFRTFSKGQYKPPRREILYKVRDDFDQKTKDVLFKRVGGKCSNPGCRQVTSGPHTNDEKAMNMGVAAHITAASVGGPRYDPSLSKEERVSPGNGIWLCQFCGTLVDSDAERYPVDLLRRWKREAENQTLFEVENRYGAKQTSNLGDFRKLENLMPNLLNEMRQDLLQYPLRREFVLLQRSWTYWAGGHELCYFYDDHNDLEGMISILCNYNLVRDITYNSVKRYVFLEELVDYLTQDRTEA